MQAVVRRLVEAESGGGQRLGLRVGLTFASSIPAAVISMAILSAVKDSSILENNIVQTIASAAGTLAAIIFVLPGLVMIAGGVGITPMMSMLRTLAHRRDRRPHRLVVVARTLDELLFRAELSELQQRLDLTVVELLRSPPPSWTGASGAVDEDLLTALLPGAFRRNQLDYYLCGPPAMVTDVLTVLDGLDVPQPRIHTEQFDLV